MSAGARIALFCLIGLLLVALGFLIACAWLIRRRGPGEGRRENNKKDKQRKDSAGTAAACPTCRREYDGGLTFCPRDARRLVPLEELERSKSGGGICPGCRRAFDPGVRFCPHDAAELLPVSVYEATHGPEEGTAPTGVIAKICPQCRSRHDLSASFCGRDGEELVVIN